MKAPGDLFFFIYIKSGKERNMAFDDGLKLILQTAQWICLNKNKVKI